MQRLQSYMLLPAWPALTYLTKKKNPIFFKGHQRKLQEIFHFHCCASIETYYFHAIKIPVSVSFLMNSWEETCRVQPMRRENILKSCKKLQIWQTTAKTVLTIFNKRSKKHLRQLSIGKVCIPLANIQCLMPQIWASAHD